MRAEHPFGQLVTDLDVIPPALLVAERAQHANPAELAFFQCFKRVVAPLGFIEVGGVDAFAAGGGIIADRGRTLLGERLAVLIGVIVVAALETGWPGEFGFLDDIVKGNALVEDPVTARNPAILEPPLLAAE